ncbi:hypothetical protein JD78_02097 [Modestobacter roseus]|uniref:Uncharacterized protein n=1 Tax=Modestobacter roseus TaxID=1181884 RepID=A0A562IS81_9ACTN|nr:hypothetical protein [Modestobacter roseus]TWH73573.1 hypothetical protein JD78_02097 [Modestobacter roseus]
MGLMSKLTKAGVAKKAMDEARKPQNQAKIKSAISSMTNRGKSGGTKGTARRG